VTPADAPAVVASDVDDDKLFACALAGNAEIIVPGDAQVLAVRRYRDIQVLSSAGLLALLEGA
jgi:predicted nucleic acid-binding protein